MGVGIYRYIPVWYVYLPIYRVYTVGAGPLHGGGPRAMPRGPPPDMCGFKIDSARLAFFDMCGVPPLHGCTLEKRIGGACTATPLNVWVHPTPRG